MLLEKKIGNWHTDVENNEISGLKMIMSMYYKYV